MKWPVPLCQSSGHTCFLIINLQYKFKSIKTDRQYFRDISSPGVHALGVLHEVRGHLKGETDRIACADRIHHLHLIVL